MNSLNDALGLFKLQISVCPRMYGAAYDPGCLLLVLQPKMVYDLNDKHRDYLTMSIFTAFFGSSTNGRAGAITSILDMVIYAASRASNPQDIDARLDTVRAITASLQPGETLSGADEAKLVAVYIGLERYLATEDPVRTLAPSDLRSKMSPDLQKLVQQYAGASSAEHSSKGGL